MWGNFSSFYLLYCNSHKLNSHNHIVLITRNILTSRMPYSREELLSIRTDTLSLSKLHEWNSMNSVFLPNNRGPQARLDTSIISKAGHKQRAIPTNIRPRLHVNVHNNTKTWNNHSYILLNHLIFPDKLAAPAVGPTKSRTGSMVIWLQCHYSNTYSNEEKPVYRYSQLLYTSCRSLDA